MLASILRAVTFGITISDWVMNSNKLARAVGKGDHKNYHMDFIACLANLRARTYSSPEVDKLNAEFIVRRIVPAIATSIALAAGLVCLELYKVLDDRHKVDDFRIAFVNLALQRLTMAKPVPPKVITYHDMSWNHLGSVDNNIR
ncbi:hypothetical protein AAC387_Pa01g4155 [Persea americana]